MMVGPFIRLFICNNDSYPTVVTYQEDTMCGLRIDYCDERLVY